MPLATIVSGKMDQSEPVIRNHRVFAGTVERNRHLSILSVGTTGKKEEVNQMLLEAPCGVESEGDPR